MSILVNVVGQKMYVSSDIDELVDGSQQFVEFKFILSPEWDGLVTFAQFRQGDVAYNEYLNAENCVCLPARVTAGICTMMLYGSKDETIGTTNYITFKINHNNLIVDSDSIDIPPSLYGQLVSRINLLLNSGETASDMAEVVDLRVTVDGATFDSAGDAVRKQISDLWRDIDTVHNQLSRLQANKADEVIPIDAVEKLLQGYFIRGTDGQQQAVSGERCTDFIPVAPGIGLLQGENLLLQGNRAFCFYDSSKNFLQTAKTQYSGATVQLEVPEGAAYFRTSVSPTAVPSFSYVQIIEKQFADTNDRIDAVEQHMEETQTSWVERIHPQTPPIDLTGKILGGGFIRGDGTEGTDADTNCTDYIPVTGGYSVHFTNVFLRSNRAICAYDENKNLIKCLCSQTEQTDITVMMPENAAYFRASVQPKNTPTANYIDILGTVEARLKALDMKAREDFTKYAKNISPNAVTVELSEYILNDRFIRANGTEGTQNGERCTDFVPVLGGYSVHFTGLLLQGARSLNVYDADKNFLRCLLSGTNQTDITVRIPEDAVYFRTSVSPSLVPEYHYSLIKDVESNIVATNNATMKCVETITPLCKSPDMAAYLVTNQFIRGDGTAGNQEGERCTDFVPVQGGYALHFENLFLENNRAFAAYDENKQKIATLLTQSNQTEVTLTMPEAAAYFRTSVQPSAQPSCSYLPLLHQVEEKLNGRITALENRLSQLALNQNAPTEALTESEMAVLLETAEVGSVYKYADDAEESGIYENGALYVVEESE